MGAHRRFIRLSLRLGLVRLLLVSVACTAAADGTPAPRSTLFVGMDVSGSFQSGGRYDDAIDFAARYIQAHLTGAGGLEEPRALFVSSIGGERPGQPQAFHPIHDFRGKGLAEIESDLRWWFPPDDRLTDFNAFFRRAATEAKRRNLVLAPITVVILSDGVPDTGGEAAGDVETRIAAIDMDPLEYLARNVTVRLLYPDPEVAVAWERQVERTRVRLWTVDHVVMEGWREQLVPTYDRARTAAGAAGAGSDAGPSERAQGDAAAGAADAADAAGTAGAQALEEPFLQDTLPPTEAMLVEYGPDQPRLWRWIQDNVDFRVRSRVF